MIVSSSPIPNSPVPVTLYLLVLSGSGFVRLTAS